MFDACAGWTCARLLLSRKQISHHLHREAADSGRPSAAFPPYYVSQRQDNNNNKAMKHFYTMESVLLMLTWASALCLARYLCACEHVPAAVGRWQRDLFGLFVYGAGPFLPSDVRGRAMNGALSGDTHPPSPHDLNAESVGFNRN